MACSSITHYACCGHGVNRVMSTSSSPVKSNTSVKASTSSSCITTPQITVSSSTRSRFTHLTPLLSELVASSSTDVPLILDPWIPFLSVDDWRVLIADVGPKNWSSSLQVFYTFKKKSSLWNELQEKETLDDGTSSILKMYTTLIRVLGRKQRRQEIASVQKQMEEHNITADVTFYNALLMFYADNGQADDLWEGLRRMKAAGIEPDHLTYELLITGLLHGEAPDLERTENALKGLLKERFPISASTFKKLIQAFWKAADIEGAERTFTALQESGYLPDLKVIQMLMQLHGRKGNYERNLELFNFLKRMGIKQTEGAYVFLLHSYCKAGRLKEAQEAFKNFQKVTGSKPSLVAFNMIIDACGKHGLHEEALLHYGDLCNSGLELNVVSYCSIISAMVNVGKYKKAEHLYRRAQLKGIRTDLHLHLKMIHCYTKCKKTRLGHEIYSLIQKLRMKMTSTAYSTVLALYVEGAWYNHAASILKHLEVEGISLDRSAHGLLIRAFGSIKDNMAPLIKAVEASQYDVCRLLTSLSLTREEGPKWSSTWIRLVKEYIERIEGDDADSQSILGIYNAFLDCFWQRGLKQAAKILLEDARKDCAVSTCPKIYETELVLDIRGLSVGGSKVAVAEWLNDVCKSTPEDFLHGKKMVIITGVGSFPNMFEGELAYSQRKGLKAALLHLFEELDSPFSEAPENPTVVEASTVDVFEWISRVLKRETDLVDRF